jgi:regulator of RNase E activity RraA
MGIRHELRRRPVRRIINEDVVVVPRAEAPGVFLRARKQAEVEEQTRELIRAGKSVEEFLAQFGRL